MSNYNRNEPLYFWGLVAAGTMVLLAGLYAAHMMEEHGHIITGMNNQVVWGMPHVFAIFMIVAASGVLNIASIGSVFGKSAYKGRGPLAGMLSIALLAGGLFVLMLDLGRPDRIIVAATHYNVTSVFAWNILLYSGLFTFVALYMWTLLERRMNPWIKPAGLIVFAWRIILTTGTGLIFAFLVARQAYASPILPPMFLVMSFAWGMAVFFVVQSAMYSWNRKILDPVLLSRMKNLLGIFVIGALYLVAVYHLTNLYFARQTSFEHFILVKGGIYPWLFWAGYVVLGSALPLLLIFSPGLNGPRSVLIASILTILGAFSMLYVFIIGGQAFPLDIFPGYEVKSSFGDGQIGQYQPSQWEFLLGFGGLAIAFLITTIGVRALNFVPQDKPLSIDKITND